MSARTPSDEGFLSRWSRRKRDGEGEELPAAPPAAPATEAAAPATSDATEPEPELVEPPSLVELVETTPLRGVVSRP